MAVVSLTHIKAGSRLSEDVLTPLGGVLYQKGTVIALRDLEIMEAFLISNVSIEDPVNAANKGNQSNSAILSKEAEAKSDNSTIEKKTAAEVDKIEKALTPFQIEYDKMVDLVRNVFATQVTSQGMPIMDLRIQLEKLLQHIDQYKILTFMPRSFVERDYLVHNSVACALTSYLIGQWTAFPQKDWMQIALAGLLHDIGNNRIDRSILSKPNSLSNDEKEEMKRHTIYGYQMLKGIAALNEGVKLTALQHHEKIDGTGYPLGIDATRIHPYAKIVAVADIFHAMTLNKAYRKGISPYLVLDQIEAEAYGKLEPYYVRTFIEKVVQFSNGTIVKLNDNRVGEIVFTDKSNPTRPWVSINETIVNLTKERQYHIKEIIS